MSSIWVYEMCFKVGGKELPEGSLDDAFGGSHFIGPNHNKNFLEVSVLEIYGK
jgi:hypothetical protein